MNVCDWEFIRNTLLSWVAVRKVKCKFGQKSLSELCWNIRYELGDATCTDLHRRWLTTESFRTIIKEQRLLGFLVVWHKYPYILCSRGISRKTLLNQIRLSSSMSLLLKVNQKTCFASVIITALILEYALYFLAKDNTILVNITIFIFWVRVL